MVKVVFVCLGNICRSPMAEGLFVHHVKRLGLERYFQIDSSGTGAYHIGKQPDQRMSKTAAARGVLLNHCARQFQKKDLIDFDYVIPMDAENLKNIQKLVTGVAGIRAQVIKMRDFDALDTGSCVPDPYYGGDQGFVEVYEMLDRCTRNFLDFLVKKHKLG